MISVSKANLQQQDENNLFQRNISASLLISAWLWIKLSSLGNFKRWRTPCFVSLTIGFNLLRLLRTSSELNLDVLDQPPASPLTEPFKAYCIQPLPLLTASRTLLLIISPLLMPIPLVWELVSMPVRYAAVSNNHAMCASTLLSSDVYINRGYKVFAGFYSLCQTHVGVY